MNYVGSRLRLFILAIFLCHQTVRCQNEEGSVSGDHCNCERCVTDQQSEDGSCQCESGYSWDANQENCTADPILDPPSLSAGAIAGITIGVTIGFFALVLVVYYFVVRKPNLTSGSLELSPRMGYNKHKDMCHSVSEVASNPYENLYDASKAGDDHGTRSSERRKDDDFVEQSTDF